MGDALEKSSLQIFDLKKKMLVLFVSIWFLLLLVGVVVVLAITRGCSRLAR